MPDISRWLMALSFLAAAGCRSLPPAGREAAILERFEGTRYFAPASDAFNGEIAVCVHGLFRSSRNLSPIGRGLAREGYRAFAYDYESTRKEVPELGSDFRAFLMALAENYPGEKINIVTHSMGGLLTRFALAHLDPRAPAEWVDAEAAAALTPERLGRIVMIAPPNQGSEIARLACFVPYGDHLVRPIGNLSCGEEGLAARLPMLQGIDIGVIAARYDIAVAKGLEYYPAAKETIVVSSTHSTAPLSKRVRRAVLRFLGNGEF